MDRYIRILLSLVALGYFYFLLGGFDPLDPMLTAPPHLDVTPEEFDTVSEEEGPDLSFATEIKEAIDLPIEDETFQPDPLLADDGWKQLDIRRGESFYVAARRIDLDHETIMALVKAGNPHLNLKKVSQGDRFHLQLDEDQKLNSFRCDLDDEHFLKISSSPGGLVSEVGNYPVTITVKGVRGTILTSLFDSLKDRGTNPALAGQLADILGWNIDFFRDLRKGDSFVLVYEELSREGRVLGPGRIQAAQFENQNRLHQAYLYENDLGLPAYYDETGASLEKQFLRAPLRYSRISSGFSKRRLHPVLKKPRPHYGIDYAAPVGTPILATADGIVTKKEYRRGNGNYVAVRHGPVYESFYLHMSKFPSGLKVGNKVKQGDVIGFVGQTGWATGPHLDYRIKKNGHWVNPRKLKLPPADPIAEAKRENYEQRKLEHMAALQSVPESMQTVVISYPEVDPLASAATGSATTR